MMYIPQRFWRIFKVVAITSQVRALFRRQGEPAHHFPIVLDVNRVAAVIQAVLSDKGMIYGT